MLKLQWVGTPVLGCYSPDMLNPSRTPNFSKKRVVNSHDFDISPLKLESTYASEYQLLYNSDRKLVFIFCFCDSLGCANHFEFKTSQVWNALFWDCSNWSQAQNIFFLETLCTWNGSISISQSYFEFKTLLENSKHFDF